MHFYLVVIRHIAVPFVFAAANSMRRRFAARRFSRKILYLQFFNSLIHQFLNAVAHFLVDLERKNEIK